LYKFGKKSLSTQGEFGFPFIMCTNFPPPIKLLAPKLPKSATMKNGGCYLLAIGL
jgi:hypothetical protein